GDVGRADGGPVRDGGGRREEDRQVADCGEVIFDGAVLARPGAGRAGSGPAVQLVLGERGSRRAQRCRDRLQAAPASPGRAPLVVAGWQGQAAARGELRPPAVAGRSGWPAGGGGPAPRSCRRRAVSRWAARLAWWWGAG